MSSPPRIDFPTSDDVEMEDEIPVLGRQSTQEQQSMSQAPPRGPLFFAGTPSTMSSPASFRDLNMPETPVRGITARRALRMSATPKRTPLFNPASSSPMQFPSSSGRTPRRRTQLDSDALFDSDPLDFPSTPGPGGPSHGMVPATPTTVRNLRGDIHSSLSITPTRRPSTTPRPQQPEQQNLNSDGLPPLSAPAVPTDEPDEIRAIWGTTVNLADTMKLTRDFLRNFKPKYRATFDRAAGRPTRIFASPADAEILLYENYLRRMRQTGETNLNLDMHNLLAYPASRKLHAQLAKYPQEVVPAMDQVLKDLMLELADADQAAGFPGMVGPEGDAEISEILGRVYKVRPMGLPSVNMRALNPADTDKLVCIKGLVIRATPVLPDMKVAFFRCLNCAHTMQVEIDRGKIAEPARCPRDLCGAIGTLSLIHNRSTFADRQVVRLQETPDAVPDGQTPHTVSLSVYDELVDVSKPGDRITVTGIFRSVPVRVNPRQRAVRSLFKTYIDVVHIRAAEGVLARDRSTRSATGDSMPGVGGVGDGEDDGGEGENIEGKRTRRAEQEAKLEALSRREDLYELLATSLAPSIWEMDDVKKGILLQLFGGTNKNIARGGGAGGPRYRGDINVLLVGDPGTSKSQILKYVHKIAPRGVYTSGKGSSAVGLTAYVTRDPDSKQLVLESGALVLSDGGVCCIDEFDKMSDATRSVLHEVMEQQTVSIAKAGIITTLNARTSILAAANPVGSKYDTELPITRNIDLPPTLISRFDLLYLVLDHVDETLDRRLAQHLVSLYLEDSPESAGSNILPIEDLSAYIDYARNKAHPILSEEASEELVRAYVEMRNMGDDPRAREKRITATTRQLESMIRLAEAHARMRCSSSVGLQDVREAVRLMRAAIRASAMDPRTGKIDMGLLNTGTGAGQRRAREDMRKEVLNLLLASGSRGARWVEVIKRLGEQSSARVDAAEFGEVVKGLVNEGLVKVIGEREKRVIRRTEG